MPCLFHANLSLWTSLADVDSTSDADYTPCTKIAPFSVEDGAIRLLGLYSQAYAKRATSSWRTSVILTSELTGTNSLTPW